MKKKYLNIAIMAVVFTGFGQVANAAIVENFSSLSSGTVLNSLDGLNWTNAIVMDGSTSNNGYNFSDPSTFGNNVAYNGDGSAMTIMSPDGLLTNGSAYFTAAYYSSLPLTIQGLDKNGQVITGDVKFANLNDNQLLTQSPQLVNFGFTDAYGVKISTDATNASVDPSLGGVSSTQFAMTNFSATISPVPEPEQWAMLLLGLPLALRFAKRHVNLSV